MTKLSKITIREKGESKTVNITSKNKPEIHKSVIDKWQSLIDTMAKIASVPSGLIMKLNEDTIEVFLKSNTKGNPYEAGEKAELIYGLYCETVIGTQKKLLVPDARKSDVWGKNNPDVDIDMISYLGYPINWSDGEVFGTICLLDNKENNYSKDFDDLLKQMKTHVENDLNILELNKNLNNKNKELENLNFTNSRFLSLISHDVRGNIATIDEFLKLIIKEFDNYDKPKLKLFMEAISQNASESYQTLENLLNWSKNDILQLQPEITNVDLISIIEKVLFYFKQSLSLKNIKINKTYDDAKAFVQSDENMIAVSLRNIISNAIKYSNPKSEIDITVKKNNNRKEIIIKDYGKGISEDELNNFFNYSSDHSEGSMGESSAGVGLLLTKEFLDKIDASVFVESKPGEGTSISVII